MAGGDQYSPIRAQRFLNGLYPNEQHTAGGDCINPKCDYTFTPEDEQMIHGDEGWFTCPKCGKTYNYYTDSSSPGGVTRAGLTMTQLGNIGETIVANLQTIPSLGPITWTSSEYKFPIDMIAGQYGCEIKTNHSESQARFKISGSAENAQKKLQYCKDNNLVPALVGVRLNFYTDKADVFTRPGSFTDTWIGAPTLLHVATVDFTSLNPYKHPEDVPPPQDLPADDSTPAGEFPF